MMIFFYPIPAEFEDDPDLYVLKPIKYVGIEVWQVYIYIFFCLLFLLLYSDDLFVMFKFEFSGEGRFDL